MTAGRSVNSQSKDWGTPPKYVEAVKSFFGGRIALDPCSSEYSIVDAVTEYRLPDIDGLRASWDYSTIYVNPPYGLDRERGTSIKNWLARCAEANDMYHSEVIALVPVAANTSHWKKSVFTRAAGICFLYDTRLKFLEKGRSGGKGAPMACAMIYWGSYYESFYEVFINHGAVVDIRPLVGEKIGVQKKNRQLFLIKDGNTSS